MWNDFLPEYMLYWHEVGLGKFVRIFWFFVIFELTRYIGADFWIMLKFMLTKKKREKQWALAKAKLWAANPKVGIVIPGKNEGKHLYKLVKSLEEQTWRNYELIIVDDGSDDDTPIIGRNLEEHGLIDRFIRNDIRGGKASAANVAYQMTDAEIIVHLDADCSFDRDAIENVIIPFWLKPDVGAVGGNVKIRNHDEGLCTKMQAIEYLKTVSTGRILTSEAGIYRVVSGAFGAFRRDILDMLGGWDIGPGLDGDISVKIMKSGYNVLFEPKAVCLTACPDKFKKLRKQRLRWDKSIIRFRVRKHKDVFLPHKNFQWRLAISCFENIFYNVGLDIMWWLYIVDVALNYSSNLNFIMAMNLTLYVVAGMVQMVPMLYHSERRKEEIKYLPYTVLMPIYTGVFLRLVRTQAYYEEFFFRKSYADPWNPRKSSNWAKKLWI